MRGIETSDLYCISALRCVFAGFCAIKHGAFFVQTQRVAKVRVCVFFAGFFTHRAVCSVQCTQTWSTGHDNAIIIVILENRNKGYSGLTGQQLPQPYMSQTSDEMILSQLPTNVLYMTVGIDAEGRKQCLLCV
ncbi:Hypothetical_protein [Hexamita inflata]|uniref:Hypothetical_protein n=1 Tax=Hexamita inflata TaxID=28002 RepID=A0AA86N4W7_9EUKA|nr:Hypothetical protein HINF_LOCUS550 [Hexamita inflata]